MEINFKGLSFVVDHNDYQEFWDNFNNWENKDLDFVTEKAEKDKIFIDIGAWIGPYTLVAAKLCMKVFAFEPDKIAFEVLKKNIQLNEFKYKPEIYNFGLSKKETIKQKLRRKKAAIKNGTFDPESGDRFTFHESDLRYKHIAPVEKENTAAVIFFVMDVSGSMTTDKKFLARSFFFLLYQFLNHKYSFYLTSFYNSEN